MDDMEKRIEKLEREVSDLKRAIKEQQIPLPTYNRNLTICDGNLDRAAMLRSMW